MAMPYLDELRESLKLEAGDVIMEDWYEDLVNYLEKIEKEGAVDYVGYIHSHLIPDKDALYNVGVHNSKLKQVHSVYGYFSNVKADTMNATNVQSDDITTNEINANKGNFTEDLRLQGKRVLKDEDPIHIASFYEYAKSQVEQAIKDALLNLSIPTKIEEKKVVDVYSFYDYAKNQIEQTIKDVLLNLGIPPRPHLLGYQVDYYAPAMADIFPQDLNVQFDGRVRIKVVGNVDFYAYMKFKPNVAPIEIVAWLNDGKPIKANTWKEMDFTVNKDDKVNVKVVPTTKITILIYNIPQA